MKQNNSQNTVPSSTAQIFITAKYTLMDYLRSRRFYILLAITLIIGIVLTALVGYYHPSIFFQASGFLSPASPSLPFYTVWWGQTATFIVILSGIFFGGDAISGEFQNKTGYFSVPNPVRRSSIYFGKWLSAFAAASVILGVFTAITIGNGLFYFGAQGFPVEMVESILFCWLYLASVLGVTFFFSSLFKSNSMSILITAILFLFVFNIIQLFVSFLARVEPWFILTYGAGIIGSVLGNLIPSGIGGISMYTPSIALGLGIMAAYFIITTVLGLLLFERKEFT
jgi:ABC-2 type transport system permease protein